MQLAPQMDMVEEAANLQRFRHNFRHREDVVFPEPLMEHCRRCRTPAPD